MSKTQTRRAISFARPIYDAVFAAAAEAGVPAAQWLTDLIRTAIPGLPSTYHTGVQPSLEGYRAHRKAVHKMTAEQVDAVIRPTIDAPWCAVCLSETGPFYAEPLGRDNAIVAVCDPCSGESPRTGRYGFSGDRGDRVLGAAGDGNRRHSPRGTGARR